MSVFTGHNGTDGTLDSHEPESPSKIPTKRLQDAIDCDIATKRARVALSSRDVESSSQYISEVGKADDSMVALGSIIVPEVLHTCGESTHDGMSKILDVTSTAEVTDNSSLSKKSSETTDTETRTEESPKALNGFTEDVVDNNLTMEQLGIGEGGLSSHISFDSSFESNMDKILSDMGTDSFFNISPVLEDLAVADTITDMLDRLERKSPALTLEDEKILKRCASGESNSSSRDSTAKDAAAKVTELAKITEGELCVDAVQEKLILEPTFNNPSERNEMKSAACLNVPESAASDRSQDVSGLRDDGYDGDDEEDLAVVGAPHGRSPMQDAETEKSTIDVKVESGSVTAVVEKDTFANFPDSVFIQGAQLVKNPLGYMKRATDTDNWEEFQGLKLIFLCTSQLTAVDYSMIYKGYVFAVQKETYFHENAYSSSAKCVRVHQEDTSFTLPLTYPSSTDLKICQDMKGEGFTAEDISLSDEESTSEGEQLEDEESDDDLQNGSSMRTHSNVRGFCGDIKAIPMLASNIKSSKRNRFAFLIKSQITHSDRMKYEGCIVKVLSSSRFYMISHLECLKVQVEDDGFSVVLPALFPTDKELFSCRNAPTYSAISNGCMAKGFLNGAKLVCNPLSYILDDNVVGVGKKLVFACTNKKNESSFVFGHVLVVDQGTQLYEDVCVKSRKFAQFTWSEFDVLLPAVYPDDESCSKLELAPQPPIQASISDVPVRPSAFPWTTASSTENPVVSGMIALSKSENTQKTKGITESAVAVRTKPNKVESSAIHVNDGKSKTSQTVPEPVANYDDIASKQRLSNWNDNVKTQNAASILSSSGSSHQRKTPQDSLATSIDDRSRSKPCQTMTYNNTDTDTASRENFGTRPWFTGTNVVKLRSLLPKPHVLKSNNLITTKPTNPLVASARNANSHRKLTEKQPVESIGNHETGKKAEEVTEERTRKFVVATPLYSDSGGNLRRAGDVGASDSNISLLAVPKSKEISSKSHAATAVPSCQSVGKAPTSGVIKTQYWNLHAITQRISGIAASSSDKSSSNPVAAVSPPSAKTSPKTLNNQNSQSSAEPSVSFVPQHYKKTYRGPRTVPKLAPSAVLPLPHKVTNVMICDKQQKSNETALPSVSNGMVVLKLSADTQQFPNIKVSTGHLSNSVFSGSQLSFVNSNPPTPSANSNTRTISLLHANPKNCSLPTSGIGAPTVPFPGERVNSFSVPDTMPVRVTGKSSFVENVFKRLHCPFPKLCKGCRTTNCKECANCKDMRGNGGPGKIRRRCIRRVCDFKDFIRNVCGRCLPCKRRPCGQCRGCIAMRWDNNAKESCEQRQCIRNASIVYYDGRFGAADFSQLTGSHEFSRQHGSDERTASANVLEDNQGYYPHPGKSLTTGLRGPDTYTDLAFSEEESDSETIIERVSTDLVCQVLMQDFSSTDTAGVVSSEKAATAEGDTPHWAVPPSPDSTLTRLNGDGQLEVVHIGPGLAHSFLDSSSVSDLPATPIEGTEAVAALNKWELNTAGDTPLATIVCYKVPEEARPMGDNDTSISSQAAGSPNAVHLAAASRSTQKETPECKEERVVRPPPSHSSSHSKKRKWLTIGKPPMATAEKRARAAAEETKQRHTSGYSSKPSLKSSTARLPSANVISADNPSMPGSAAGELCEETPATNCDIAVSNSVERESTPTAIPPVFGRLRIKPFLKGRVSASGKTNKTLHVPPSTVLSLVDVSHNPLFSDTSLQMLFNSTYCYTVTQLDVSETLVGDNSMRLIAKSMHALFVGAEG